MSSLTLPTVLSDRLVERRWPAHWATFPNAQAQIGTGGAVFLFRKEISLDVVPDRYIVHISADQRYRFYVNGTSVSFGPARGDLMHYRFETVDIAPYLKPGTNVLAARVHYFTGENAPVAQITSGYPGFLLQGDTEDTVNTPSGWRVEKDDAYSFTREPADILWTYAVVGPSEIFDAAKHPTDWLLTGFDDSSWQEAKTLKDAAAFGTPNAESHWWLIQRTIPAMEESPIIIGKVRRSEGVVVPAGFGESSSVPLIVPPHTKAVLLLDHGVETCAFPQLTVSGGASATIQLGYAEGLQEAESRPDHHAKGNRNEIAGKILRGYVDTWLPTGGEAAQTLDTLWWRTFRYAELTVETGDAPLTIQSLSALYTGYPWQRKAACDAPAMPELSTIREVGWRTVRLCSHETFMDCPYYEQLQYAGDTRIQCLASLYETGDPTLFRNALRLFDDSRATFGLTMSRYPARVPQVIPTFSLWWVCMIHDYWMHVPDSEPFVRSLLPGVRSVLEWFDGHLRSDGLMGPVPHWNFVDWCRSKDWDMGMPPGTQEGGSSILTLQFALALQAAQQLFRVGDDEVTAQYCSTLAAKVVEATRSQCLLTQTARIADTPAHNSFSQHASVFGLLAGVVEGDADQQAILRTVREDSTLTQATFYCRFYLNRALAAVGKGDDYLATLAPWYAMLDLGLTTWAEEPEPTRSDCHAWSASPNYELLATVLGVGPGAKGWGQTNIAPHLGTLTDVSGVVPIPNGGEVVVSYRLEGTTSLHADITLPESGPGANGTLSWQGVQKTLQPGRQQLVLKSE